MKMSERERCGRCQKWVNIYKDYYLDPRDEKGIMPCVCRKCSEIIMKENDIKLSTNGLSWRM